MNIETSAGAAVSSTLLKNYFSHLVNQFFKILPMREQNEETLPVYIESLHSELFGAKGLVPELYSDPLLLTLLSTLQYLIDNPQLSVSKVKREVFKAISVCNKLGAKYTSAEVKDDCMG